MMRAAQSSTSKVAAFAAGVAALAVATGAAFAAWADQAPAIFLSLVESGLSWCF